MHCVGVGGQGPKRGLCFESAQLQAANMLKTKAYYFQVLEVMNNMWNYRNILVKLVICVVCNTSDTLVLMVPDGWWSGGERKSVQ